MYLWVVVLVIASAWTQIEPQCDLIGSRWAVLGATGDFVRFVDIDSASTEAGAMLEVANLAEDVSPERGWVVGVYQTQADCSQESLVREQTTAYSWPGMVELGNSHRRREIREFSARSFLDIEWEWYCAGRSGERLALSTEMAVRLALAWTDFDFENRDWIAVSQTDESLTFAEEGAVGEGMGWFLTYSFDPNMVDVVGTFRLLAADCQKREFSEFRRAELRDDTELTVFPVIPHNLVAETQRLSAGAERIRILCDAEVSPDTHRFSTRSTYRTFVNAFRE